MNDPAPKPCPFCSKPAEMVQQGCYGCSDRECPAYLANIVLRLWNRRPNPETQAVAQLEVRNGIAGLKHLLAPIDQVSDGMMLYRSPVESVPISALRELVEELRKEGDASIQGPCCSERRGETKIECADRLSAVIRGTKT